MNSDLPKITVKIFSYTEIQAKSTTLWLSILGTKSTVLPGRRWASHLNLFAPKMQIRILNKTVNQKLPKRNSDICHRIQGLNPKPQIMLSVTLQARMERDMSARRIYGEEELPEGGAGSEFGKKQREEARRKKFGIVTREFKVEDQPWILKVNGKAGKR